MSDRRIAIVTGGARGIGFEIGQSLARMNIHVLLADINEAGVLQAAERIGAIGPKPLGMRVDVSCKSDVQGMVRQVHDRWGRIDILVNNAGICHVTPIDQITEEDWDLTLGVNLKGTFLCCQAVIPTMLKQQHGKIVNISSSAGQMGGLAVGVHYSASKAGILGLTKSLARILAPSIQVNAIAPGTTDTEMTRGWDTAVTDDLAKQIPMGRLAIPSDVAAVAAFLVSEEASFITGQTLSVNGGLLMP